MPAASNPQNYAVPSIQTVYTLYEYTDGVYRKSVPTFHCKNVIKIPIAEPVAWKIGIDTYTVTPCTALVIENNSNEYFFFKIFIETNEGVTVEPIVVHDPLVPYDTAYLLTLPRGTTGIKKAYIGNRNGYRAFQNDLVFDIMEAPYNYENYLHALNYAEIVDLRDRTADEINELNKAVLALDGRVDALESKRLYVKQAPLTSYPGFFKIFGTNDQNDILGWEFTFTNTGNMLTLASGYYSGDLSDNNVILKGIGIAESKKLTLNYNKVTNIFNLYDITEGENGNILHQKYLASGLGRITDAQQDLHLVIDALEQDVLNIGSGFVYYI